MAHITCRRGFIVKMRLFECRECPGLPDRNCGLAHGQNLVFDEFIRSMGMRIRRDSRGRPIRLFPWRDSDSNGQPVSMDPDVMSGELVVTGTRIPAARIMANYLAGKSAKQIADSYGLGSRDIRKRW